MDYPYSVRRLQRTADLLDNLDRVSGRKLRIFEDQRTQVFALDKFHGDELNPVGIAQIVNPDDVFVGHLMREQKLLLEARDDGGIRGEFAPDQF